MNESMPKMKCKSCGEEFHGWSIKFMPIIACPYCGTIHENHFYEYPEKGIEEAIDQA